MSGTMKSSLQTKPHGENQSLRSPVPVVVGSQDFSKFRSSDLSLKKVSDSCGCAITSLLFGIFLKAPGPRVMGLRQNLNF